VFEAAIRLVGERGVSSLTFASLSEATSLAPPTLVQRFKTKKELLAATATYCLQKMEPAFKEAVGSNTSPLNTLLQAFTAMSGAITDAKAFANGQAFIQLALTDAHLNQTLRSAMDAMRLEIVELLDKAIASKELRPCDTHALANALQAVYEGGIVTWAVYQQEPAGQWVSELLQTVIEPYKIIKEK
jgi:AcrR family transcriptional regulator